MTKHWVRLAFLAAGGIGLLHGAALAQGEADEGISPQTLMLARQAGYDLMMGNLLAMQQAVKEKLEVKPYRAGAGAMARWAREIPNLFPPGTDRGVKTRALPAVWTDRAEFEKDAANLAQAAGKLAEAARADDKAAFATAFQATSDACDTCHQKFRKR